MEAEVKTKIKRGRRTEVPIKERKRIPVSKVYFKKGMYKELVDDPYNLKE